MNEIFVESVDTSKLGENDIIQIAEVEKDMWAYGIGEYVKCNNCGNSSSKNDIYGYLENELKIESVTKIENILGYDSIKCNTCNNDTEFVYDINSNIINIKERYFKSESYLSLARNGDGNIVGFCDGYIDSLEVIYYRFFDYYYPKLGYDGLKSVLEKELNTNIPDEFLVWTSIGTLEKYKSFFIFYELMKSFFYSIDKLDILGISDSVIGTNTQGVYTSLGAKRLGLNNFNIAKYDTDIFIHENAVQKYQAELNGNVKNFLKKYGKQMRRIINNGHK